MTFIETRNSIQQELDGINDLRQSGKAPYSLEPRVQKIVDYLLQLKGLTTDEDYKKSIDVARQAVFHTQHKEVGFVDSAYQKTLKKNVAKVRKREYEATLTDAVSHLERDLFMVLNTDPKDHLADRE